MCSHTDLADLEKLIQDYDRAVQTREAADHTGYTNYTQEEARRMVSDAKQAIIDFMIAK